MCGIAGILATGKPEGARLAVERMMAAANHRGPDSCAACCVPLPCGKQLIFGHTRLAIIDLSQESNQPMADPETGSYLCYNGEIYNFLELKTELVARGYHFRSHGDTEVLLKALLCWGAGALQKVRGMFAFAFWDGMRNKLMLARDPFGIKPLYYSQHNGDLVFGSEVKIIQASRFRPYTVNSDAVASFLVYGAVIRPDSIIKQICEVAPGHVLTISCSGAIESSKRFWSITDALCQKQLARDNGSVQRVSYSLRRAIKRHLIADVETAVALSGGLDSALIAVLAAHANSNIRLFTLIFREKEYSEQVAASLSARHAGAPHEVITVTSEELLNRIPMAVTSMDQPTVDGVNTLVVSLAAASHGIKVLISGLGGDEIFGGYTTFRKLPLLRDHAIAMRRAAAMREWIGLPPEPQFKKLELLRDDLGFRELYLLQRSIRWHGSAGGVTTTECPPKGYAISDVSWNELGAPTGTDVFHQIAGLELQFYMVNQLLRDADAFSMAASLEMRVPFLDLDLVTAAMRLPGSEHVQLRHGKRLERRLLHEACPHLRLPRRKRGFTFPWSEWLRGTLKASVKETILDRGSHYMAGLDSSQCERTIDQFFNGHPLVPWQQIWSLFVLFRWLDRSRALG